MKMNAMQILGLVLLIGAFLYVFEMGYHGFVQQDFNKAQIVLTFLVMLLSAGFLLGYQIIEKNVHERDIVKMFSFFGLAIVFLFIIFYTRNMNSIIPLFFSLVYFAIAVFLAFKKTTEFKEPMVRFGLRFFITLGVMILPVALFEYVTTGTIDFTLQGIYMPLISIITFITTGFLKLIGINVQAIPQAGGYTLAVVDGTFRVFVGAFCSGVSSMSVFIAAFIAMAVDLKADMKKKAGLFALGIIGTFLANVLRVILLFLTGFYFGVDALLAVHTHLGWILFFIWISIFWVLVFKLEDKEVDDNKRKSKQIAYEPK